MSEPLNFHFPISLLLKDGDTIVTAAETFAAPLSARLPGTFITDTRTLLGTVGGEATAQKGAVGGIGTLTLAQDAALKDMQLLVAAAKDTAKKAFKGNDVKLHEEFQVGVNKPEDLGAVLGRARIILASLQRAENLPALNSKGWIAADTTKLQDAIDALKGADQIQETAKGDKLDTTGGRNHDANDLFDRVTTMQNAANLQFPASDPASSGTRAKFRLGQFPPKGGSGGKSTPPTPPPPPPTP